MTSNEISRALQEATGKWIPIPHESASGHVKVVCPFCMDRRGNPKDRSLSIRVDNGVYHCHHCEAKGILSKSKSEKQYVIPKREFTESNDDLIQFLETRGLPASIADMREVGYFLSAKKGAFITFNYYENNRHINTKYRGLGEKIFMLEPGAKLGLYLGDYLKLADKYAIITEGELDALSWRAAGYQFVVSVPNGASNNTSYMDDYLPIFDKIETIYLATDGDDKGVELAHALADRVGREKCRLVRFPSGVKDTNDILQKYDLELGIKLIKECFESAVPFPLDGIETVQDNMEEAYQYLIHGYPETLPCGVPGLDDLFTLYFSEVTIITGAPGSGKSNLVDAMSVELSKRYGLRCGFLSAEKSSSLHITGLVRKYQRKDSVSSSEALSALEHLNDHFYYISTFGMMSVDDVLHKGEQLVRSRGIRVFVIDNLSCLKNSSSSSISDAASEQMTKIKGFAKRYRAAVFLVAHPRKLQRNADGFYDAPDGYDILGSSHYYNLADNIIAVTREEGSSLKIVTRKIKNMEFVAPTGDLGVRTVSFDRALGGNYSEVSPEEIKRMSNAREGLSDDFFKAAADSLRLAIHGDENNLDFGE